MDFLPHLVVLEITSHLEPPDAVHWWAACRATQRKYAGDARAWAATSHLDTMGPMFRRAGRQLPVSFSFEELLGLPQTENK